MSASEETPREQDSPAVTAHRRRPRKWWASPTLGVAWATFVVLLGVLLGLGVFAFGYGKGGSYLSNNPESCVNCHAMQGHFDSWQHSSHHHVAVCNDCHLPHHPIGKWVVKADNGFFHSLAFTLQNFHEPIQIKPRNARVTQNTCLYCHQDFVHNLLPPDVVASESQDPPLPQQENVSCVHCHKDVGHAGR